MADLLTRLRAVVAADNAIVQAKADRRAQDIKVYGEEFGRRTYSRSFWRGLYAARERAERELWGTQSNEYAVTLAVAHTLLDRRRRPIADVRHEILDVGPRVRHVAELQRQKVLLRRAAQALLEHLDVAAELDGGVVADVVDAIRRAAGGRIRMVLDEGRIGRGRAVEHAHHAFGFQLFQQLSLKII